MELEMTHQVVTAIAAVADRVVDLSREDARLRSELRTLAEAILEAVGSPLQTPTASVAHEHSAEPLSICGEASQLVPNDDQPLTIAQPAVVSAVRTPNLPVTTSGTNRPTKGLGLPSMNDPTLQQIESCCRLKAEGARWAAARQELVVDGASYLNEIQPADQAIIQRGKALNCFLWMNASTAPIPQDLSLWGDVADAFEATAAAIALVRVSLTASEHPRVLERALDLLAESQSMLRSAVGLVGAPTDSEQAGIFNWLKATASSHQIFIRRFMKVDDSADPANLADLSARISGLMGQLQAQINAGRQRARNFSRLRYHIKAIQGSRGTDHDWTTVAASVNEMIQEGLPPSNVELRDILLPVIDDMPELGEIPEGFQRVSLELDRYLASRTTDSPATVQETLSSEVRAVRRLLKDRSVVLIGGDSRETAKGALESAFQLNELIWIGTREHQSPATFEPYVARPEVAVVILAIRWASHSYGNVKAMCDERGKAFVRLPSGYSPNQVAHQILEQVGDQLGKLPPVENVHPSSRSNAPA
jgi:hypothetical protein